MTNLERTCAEIKRYGAARRERNAAVQAAIRILRTAFRAVLADARMPRDRRQKALVTLGHAMRFKDDITPRREALDDTVRYTRAYRMRRRSQKDAIAILTCARDEVSRTLSLSGNQRTFAMLKLESAVQFVGLHPSDKESYEYQT